MPVSDLSFDSTATLENQFRSLLCACFPSVVVKPKSCAILSDITKLSRLITLIKKFIFLSLILFSYSVTSFAETQNNNKTISNAWELPPLILNDLNGQKHNLYDWHGKVIMLNFWATWCGPCQIEIPDFIDYQTRYQDKGLQIIGIGLDEVRKLKNYVRTVHINYPVLQADPELQYSLLKQWGNPFGILPFTVIIARDGHFVFIQQGILNKQSFEAFVKPLLEPTKK